ncbi:MAG: pilus assembly protein PilM [Phycisphaerales bacterium]|nr:pilus assembly protein PilM [Phycisphaerales bacterium]
MSFGLMKGGQYPVAIDFGVGALKVLQLASGEPPAVVIAGALPTPEQFLNDPQGRLAFQYEALPAFLKELGVKTRRAVCSVSSSQTFVQHLHLPRNITTPARTQVSDQLQSLFQCDISQLVLRHFDVGEMTYRGARCLEVIAVAMPAAVIQSHMRALRGCRLEVVGIHTEHLAAVRAFDYLLGEEDADNSAMTNLYVDIGYGSTKIVIAHGGQPAVARTLKIGGQHLDAPVAAARQSSLTDTRARRIAGDADPEGDDTVARARAALVDRLTEDIRTCIRYHDAIAPGRCVERVIFFGGEAASRELTIGIAEALHLPAHLADAFGRLERDHDASTSEVDLTSPQPGWVTPVGLSLSPTNL